MCLKELIKECDRQYAFHKSRGNIVFEEMWLHLMDIAQEAIESGSVLVVGLTAFAQSRLIREEGRLKSPLPIKACEQVQQLQKANKDNTLRKETL